MNCPSRVDPIHPEGWNQNPDALNADATTRADLNHMANARNASRTINDWCMALRGLPVRASKILRKYATFIGPGFMVSVAYIDPGGYYSGTCFFNCASRLTCSVLLPRKHCWSKL
jgi:metal iron transporter